MEPREPLIRNISDTARWAAVYRARESERRDALFRDPFARRLAGERGEQVADGLPKGNRNSWSWVMRTWLFDQLIAEQISQGVDLVVNLAAGLDARPYRLALPPSLTWIEVDLPELLDFKESALEGEKPSCALERIRLDLSNREARRELFEELGRRAQKALILTEGLLIYLTRQEVGSLAEDLARHPAFQRWILDVVSPGLLRMIQRNWGRNLGDAGAPPKFAPLEGPPFFSRYGWDPTQVRSVFQAAARANRLPFLLQLMARLPESPGPQGSRPWSGIACWPGADGRPRGAPVIGARRCNCLYTCADKVSTEGDRRTDRRDEKDAAGHWTGDLVPSASARSGAFPGRQE